MARLCWLASTVFFFVTSSLSSALDGSSQASPSRILMLAPVSANSHLTVFRALAAGLAERGHAVTIFHTLEPEPPIFMNQSFVPHSTSNGSVVEISPPRIYNLFAKYFDNPFKLQRETRNGKGTLRLKKMFNILRNSCQDVFSDEIFLKMITEEEFDLAIVQGILNDCMLGAVHQMKIPFMYLSPGPLFPSVQWSLGTPWSVSSAPAPFVQGFGVPKTLLHRLRNLLASAAETFMSNKLGAWAAEPVINDAFPGANFDLAAVKRNVSFVLVNHLAAFDYSRAHASNSALVGGMHCRPCHEIEDTKLRYFLENATEGALYFSLGSTAQGVDMPQKTREVFMKAFAKLPMKVVWKLETSLLSESERKKIPKNVYASPWVPQQDILGHVNVRLFLTHGGLLSVQEATYHGVPMVGIPIGSDQDINLKRAATDGRAITLEFDDLNEEKVLAAINTIVHDKTFQRRADAGARLMRDEPMKPLNRAVFWTEYVIRHHGAAHMKTTKADMPWFKYLNLDLYAVLVTFGIFSVWVAVRIARAVKNAVGKLFSKISSCVRLAGVTSPVQSGLPMLTRVWSFNSLRKAFNRVIMKTHAEEAARRSQGVA